MNASIRYAVEQTMNAGIGHGLNIEHREMRVYLDDRLFHAAEQQKNTIDSPFGTAFERAAPSRGVTPLQRRFEVIAQTTPGTHAMGDGARRLTYGELDIEADALALHLQRGGLRQGSFCLLGLAPSPARVRAILAILKAGGACMECDRALSPAGVSAAMRLLRPAMLFVHEDDCVADHLRGMPVVRCVDAAAHLPHGWPDEAPVRAATPAHAVATPSADGTTCIRIMTHLGLAGAVAAQRTPPAPDAGADPVALWAALSRGAALAIPART